VQVRRALVELNETDALNRRDLESLETELEQWDQRKATLHRDNLADLLLKRAQRAPSLMSAAPERPAPEIGSHGVANRGGPSFSISTIPEVPTPGGISQGSPERRVPAIQPGERGTPADSGRNSPTGRHRRSVSQPHVLAASLQQAALTGSRRRVRELKPKRSRGSVRSNRSDRTSISSALSSASSDTPGYHYQRPFEPIFGSSEDVTAELDLAMQDDDYGTQPQRSDRKTSSLDRPRSSDGLDVDASESGDSEVLSTSSRGVSDDEFDTWLDGNSDDTDGEAAGAGVSGAEQQSSVGMHHPSADRKQEQRRRSLDLVKTRAELEHGLAALQQQQKLRVHEDGGAMVPDSPEPDSPGFLDELVPNDVLVVPPSAAKTPASRVDAVGPTPLVAVVDHDMDLDKINTRVRARSDAVELAMRGIGQAAAPPVIARLRPVVPEAWSSNKVMRAAPAGLPVPSSGIGTVEVASTAGSLSNHRPIATPFTNSTRSQNRDPRWVRRARREVKAVKASLLENAHYRKAQMARLGELDIMASRLHEEIAAAAPLLREERQEVLYLTLERCVLESEKMELELQARYMRMELQVTRGEAEYYESILRDRHINVIPYHQSSAFKASTAALSFSVPLPAVPDLLRAPSAAINPNSLHPATLAHVGHTPGQSGTASPTNNGPRAYRGASTFSQRSPGVSGYASPVVVAPPGGVPPLLLDFHNISVESAAGSGGRSSGSARMDAATSGGSQPASSPATNRSKASASSPRSTVVPPNVVTKVATVVAKEIDFKDDMSPNEVVLRARVAAATNSKSTPLLPPRATSHPTSTKLPLTSSNTSHASTFLSGPASAWNPAYAKRSASVAGTPGSVDPNSNVGDQERDSSSSASLSALISSANAVLASLQARSSQRPASKSVSVADATSGANRPRSTTSNLIANRVTALVASHPTVTREVFQPPRRPPPVSVPAEAQITHAVGLQSATGVVQAVSPPLMLLPLTPVSPITPP